MPKPESREEFLQRIIDANGRDEKAPMFTVVVSGRCGTCGYRRGKTASATTQSNAFARATGAMEIEHMHNCSGILIFETTEVFQTTPAEAIKRRS